VASGGSGVVPIGFVNAFLSEQRRTLSEKHKALSKEFPVNDKLITVAEAWNVALCQHLISVRTRKHTNKRKHKHKRTRSAVQWHRRAVQWQRRAVQWQCSARHSSAHRGTARADDRPPRSCLCCVLSSLSLVLCVQCAVCIVRWGVCRCVCTAYGLCVALSAAVCSDALCALMLCV
jgi:hypothetical protein